MRRTTRSGLTILLAAAGLLTIQLSAPAVWAQGKLTEQGTPRAETLVMDQLNGRVANARLFNPSVPGVEIKLVRRDLKGIRLRTRSGYFAPYKESR